MARSPKTKAKVDRQKKKPNVCPYWLNVIIGSQKCKDTAKRSYAIYKDGKIPGRC